ncbi:hypothetical protein AALO_G00047180 [Alosa alosa]|uniref:Uncharacterized protein n=1 Tax=Alosa alosa TaxID=278164 RepID=A0AAV6H783_9TELE|nr:hypothetical protein AALO_G00047180 [Alosa alosa]
MYSYETLAYSGGTLPRRIRNKWRPLTQSSELIRTNVVLEKNADETFGFEIQDIQGILDPRQRMGILNGTFIENPRSFLCIITMGKESSVLEPLTAR